MALNVSNRPLVAVKPAAKPVAKAAAPALTVAPAKATAPAPAASASLPVGQALTWTPPVITDIIWQSLKNGVGLVNLVWMIGPTAFNNLRDMASHKESVGRGAANIISDSTVNIGKGIAASVAVQALQIAAGPALGLLPAAALPFAGIVLGIGGLVGSYWLLGKVVKATGLNQKLSNGLTKLFGGDLPAKTTPAKA